MNVEDSDFDEYYEQDYEEYAYFSGPCSCDHEESQHGWGSCDYIELAAIPWSELVGEPFGGAEWVRCPCEAGWEE